MTVPLQDINHNKRVSWEAIENREWFIKASNNKPSVVSFIDEVLHFIEQKNHYVSHKKSD